MSIENLIGSNIPINLNKILTQSIDTPLLGQTLSIGKVNAGEIDIGGGATTILINGVPYNSGSTPVIPQRIAYFTGSTSSTVDDSGITLDGVNNSLLFQPAGSIQVDSIDSVGGTDQLSVGTATNNTLLLSNPSQNTILLGNAQVNGVFSSNTMQSLTGPLTLGLGPTTDITMDASNSIFIGHEGGVVQIIDGVVTNFVRASDIDRNGTPDPLNIGDTFASEVNIGRNGQSVNIVAGSQFTTPSISFLASPLSQINYFSTNIRTPVFGFGPFFIQIVGIYSVQRLNEMVTLNIRWSASPVTVTANSALSLTPVISQFIPSNNQSFVCSVSIDGINYSQGQITIDTSGGITIFPVVGGVWTIGQKCSFASISCSYDVSI